MPFRDAGTLAALSRIAELFDFALVAEQPGPVASGGPNQRRERTVGIRKPGRR